MKLAKLADVLNTVQLLCVTNLRASIDQFKLTPKYRFKGGSPESPASFRKDYRATRYRQYKQANLLILNIH